jgi:hypothetical protein
MRTGTKFGGKMRSFKMFFCGVLLTGLLSSAAFADTKTTAVAVSAAGDFSSGSHVTVTVDSPRTLTEDLVPAGSDMTVVSRGKYFYRMERSGANNITKFDINDPKTPVWQFSTEGSETGSNPHDLVFASDTTAFLLRYGSDRAWIVNPSASKAENFKTGEINFSDYADNDGKPEMNSGVVVGHKLFVTLQRIDYSGGWGNSVYNQSFVAVINLDTGSEINTGMGDAGLKGIALPMENPGVIQYLPATGMIYVQCFGQYNRNYTGGIAIIDPDSYESAILVDDGTSNDHPFGAVTGMVIVSAVKGYFVGYNAWGNNNLYSFNPSSFISSPVPVQGFEGKNISALEPSSLDRKGMVWVSTSDLNPETYNLGNPSIRIINSGTDRIDQTISTKLVAQKFAFCEGVPGGSSPGTDSGDSGGGCFISSLSGMSGLKWFGAGFIMILTSLSALLEALKKDRK